jgi:glyoxylase-like metal-dependent hydrolase (beta-lactamase superfamily II)
MSLVGSIEVTGVAQHSAWRERGFPPVEHVAPNVWSVPVDCSEFPIRYTFCYVILGDEGSFVVLDPGLDSPTGRDQLVSAFHRIGLQLDRLASVVVSHFHADHFAMALWLAEQTGAPIFMHPADAETVRRLADPAEQSQLDRAWLAGIGVPEGHIELTALPDTDLFRQAPSLVAPLYDDAMLDLAGRRIRCLWTPGHTAGHLCLVDEDHRLLFAGDHVLPRITPNVGLTPFDASGRDPVAEYAESLARCRALGDVEVCPAHEYRFRGLATRIDQLLDHQEERSREVAAVVADHPDASTWEVARRLTWSRGWDRLNGQNLRAALAETSAHLRHLDRSHQVLP